MKKQVLILSIMSLNTAFQAEALARVSTAGNAVDHDGRLVYEMVKSEPNLLFSIESIVTTIENNARKNFQQNSSQEQNLYTMFMGLVNQQATSEQFMETFGFSSGTALAHASSYLTVAHQNELVNLQQKTFNRLAIEDLSKSVNSQITLLQLRRLIVTQLCTKIAPISGAPTIESVYTDRQVQAVLKTLSQNQQDNVNALYHTVQTVLSSPEYKTINSALMTYGYQAFPADVQENVATVFESLVNKASFQGLFVIQSAPNFGSAYESLTAAHRNELDRAVGERYNELTPRSHSEKAN